MTPAEREAWRSRQLAQLDDLESSALQLAAATGRNMAATLGRIRRQRDRLLGAGPALQVQVSAGATRQEKHQAVLAAVAERLNDEQEGDSHGDVG